MERPNREQVRDLYAERILAKRKVTNVDKENPIRRPLFRQNAQGELVTWTNDQTELDKFMEVHKAVEDMEIIIDPEEKNRTDEIILVPK